MAVSQISSMNGQHYAAVVADAMPQPAPVKPVVVPSGTGASSSGASANSETVKMAAEAINKTIQSLSHGLEFTVDEETHKTVVRVVDTQTNEVIRQMPSEEVLAIAKALDKLQGLLLRQKA